MTDTGITVLAEGIDPVAADIIFVHGLGETPLSTWSLDNTMWPRDLLPSSIPNARIMTWGYEGDAVHFFKKQGHQSMLSHARDLLLEAHLERQTEEEEKRPIIFVGHGFGGLVVKQALIKANEFQGQGGHEDEAAIATNCSGVVFMGTPQRGISSTAWTTTATKMVAASSRRVTPEMQHSLKAGYTILQSLEESFAGIQNSLNIHTIIEKDAPGAKKVVADSHATIGCESERCFFIDASHERMCKFAEARDMSYRRLAAVLKRQVQKAPSRIEGNTSI